MNRIARTGLLCLPSLIAAVAMADAPLRLNEIRVEQPGADLDEYIELAGAPGESLAGVSIVVVGDDDLALPGAQNGVIESVISLDGLSVPKSGFFVVGEPTLSLAVANLSTSLNLEGGDNLTVFVVRGFSGTLGQKLDSNDDGVLDTTPWTEVISSLAIVANASPNGSDSDFFYSTTTVGPDNGLQPSAAWLCANSSQWVVGSVDPFAGIDSPGAANQTCASDTLVINEIRIDQTGTDNDEYFELKGGPGTDLSDLTYIVIGDGTGGSGVVEAVVPLTGQVIGGTGYFVVAEPTFTIGIADYTVAGTNGLNFENSDNVTHLLVRGFTGANADDLDTNDDGVLDLEPWSEIVDSVALVTPTVPPVGGEWTYSANVVGPDGAFVPGHVFRCVDAGDWLIGPFDPLVGKDTPGSENEICTTCGNGAGNCFEVHERPGCIDTDCCNAVCAADAACCETTWDQACVDQARALCLVQGPAPAASFNEIRIDEPTGVDPNEYIEITGTPGTSLDGVAVVIVGDGAEPNGVIEAVIRLDGAVIPEDGILLVAESSFTLGTPDVVASMNLENGDSVTYFLVFNFTGLANSDIDADGDCVLDSMPWDAMLDSLGVSGGDGLCLYSETTVGPDYFGLPAHVVKCLDGAWRFGTFDPTLKGAYDTPGSANTVCPPDYACGDAKAESCFEAHAAPGCNDQACCDAICRVDIACCEIGWDQTCADLAILECFVPKNPPAVILSEIRIDQNLTDTSEYFELYGEPGTLLNGVSYIVIGDGTGGSGTVECWVDLGGSTIPEDGFFLAARDTYDYDATVPDLVTPFIIFENSDNVTHMLVFGFKGAVGQDLDTDDDGVLDVTPWASVLDSVALVETTEEPPTTGNEWVYSDTRVGPDGIFVPSQVAFCPSTGAWTIGPFDYILNPGIDTPGAPNLDCDYTVEPNPCPADLDGNGSVDAADLAALLGSWGTADAAADLDGNGSVDAADLAALLGAWGACP
ncbi:MAG: Leukotoxin [Planctomycetota bacterium]